MFDAQSFERAYQDALPDHVNEINDKVKAKNASFALSASGVDLKSVNIGTFCTNWPKIKGFLQTAIAAVGWFMPTQAAMAKAFLTALDTAVIPLVCPAVPPTP